MDGMDFYPSNEDKLIYGIGKTSIAVKELMALTP